MEMESSRRPPFDRSREIVKKPRLSDESTLPVGPARQFRPGQGPISTGELRRVRVRETDDPTRGGLHQYQQHQELISQYKTALAELTFNSKPIITNLTIIAGENLQAAKAIASTICSNVLEVPSEQKLPSLYLLDSIVKNIGGDYIKYFAARLPEVFCKAYKLVDPSTHPSMRHLFGTWKGVFPPQPLQIIEKELGLSASVNGQSSGSAASKADSQSQRQPHSIHVNPKYLEARQRLQQSNRPKGTEIGETTVEPSDDSERPDRTTTTGRPWVDPSTKMNNIHRPAREALREPNQQRHPGAGYGDYEFASGVTRSISSAVVEPSEKLSGQGYNNKQWFGSGREVEESMSGQRNGFDIKRGISNYTPGRPTSGNVPPSLQKLTRNSVEMSRNWKNSEEEEYMWDDVGTRVTDSATLSGTKRDFLSSDDMEKLDYNPQELGTLHTKWRSPNETRSSFESEPSTDALSFPQKDRGTSLHPRLSQRKVQEPPQVDSSGPLLPQVGARSMPSVSLAGVSGVGLSKAVSPGQSPMHHHSPPPLSKRDPRQNLAAKDHTRSHSFARSDPRAASLSGQLSMGLRDQNSQPDSQGKSNVSSLLAAVMKSGLLSSSSSASGKLAVESPETSLTPKTSTSSEGGIVSPSLAQAKVEKPQLPPIPVSGSPSISSTSEQTSDVVSSNSNPLSSLFSSLVAKGLISSSKNEPIAPIPVQSKSQLKGPSDSGDTKAAVAIPSGPKPSSAPQVGGTDKLSSGESTAKISETSGQIAEAEMDNLIGDEFKPRLLREFHPSVIDKVLENLPHKCTVCGLQFKLQERLAKHSEWHALRNSIPNSMNRPTRRWYSSSMDWVAGKAGFPFGYCSSSLVKGPSELGQDETTTVPADESQCVCLLCGEVFEEGYSLERDEWMFKGAVYLPIPSVNNDSGLQNLIVHANCVTDDSVHELGLIGDVKVEKDV